jgi:putative photosynthetic complex assembly protein 2
MSGMFLAVGFVLCLWWLSTGVVLYIDGLPVRTYRWTMPVAGALMLTALYGAAATAGRADMLAAYCGFSCGLVIWGALEVSYFSGFLTGPVRSACPSDCRGWARFGRAILTSLYHELLVVGVGLGLLYATAGFVNRTVAWTFLVLWLMRWSTKLNIFLGVRNLNADWLPEHLQYLVTYMRHRPINPLFPVSVSVALVVAGYLLAAAVLAESRFEYVARLLVLTLLLLGVLEHWLLLLPYDSGKLWSWGMRKQSGPAAIAEEQR